MKKIIVFLAVFLIFFVFSKTLRSQDISSSSYSSYEEAVIAPEKKPIAGYDGGFFIQSEDGKYRLVLGSRLDTMFYWQSSYAPDDPLTPTIEESRDQRTFHIRRAELSAKTIFNEKLSFSFSVTAAMSEAAGDLTATYFPYGKYVFNDYVNIVFGMFDPEYDAQNMFSSKMYTMVDYPIIMTQKDGERPVWSSINESTTVARPSMGLPTQLGLSLSGDFFDKKLHWAFGFGNGSEGTGQFNRNNRFLYALRLSYIITGSDPYGAMNDYDYSAVPSLAIGLGGAFEHDKAISTVTGAVMYHWSLDGTSDLLFRYRGFSLNMGGYYRQIKVGPGAVWEAGEKYLTDIGYIASASMFAIPKRLEFQGWACQLIREGPDNNAYEFGGGINYYFAGPNIKLGADYSRVVDYDAIIGANHGKTNRIRAKLQLFF